MCGGKAESLHTLHAETQKGAESADLAPFCLHSVPVVNKVRGREEKSLHPKRTKGPKSENLEPFVYTFFQ